MKLRLVLVGICFLLALVGCRNVSAPPVAFQAPPWQDGETSEYDVLDASGASIGSFTWVWKSIPDGWRLEWNAVLATMTEQGYVALNAELYPTASGVVRASASYSATYASDAVSFEAVVAGGTPVRRDLALPENALDNGQTLQMHRALPLAERYAARYINVIPMAQSSALTTIRVVGAEEVETPAGAFRAWRLVMTTGQTRHEAWYAQESPYLLVKYHNRQAGTLFVLRRWRPNATAPWQGATEPAPQPLPPAEGAPSPDWAKVALAFGLQYPLMILFPLALAWWIQRRYGIGWRVWGIGALTFVLSQVVHLPLNWALGLLGPGGRGVALWPLPLVALVAGLSSGVCEEGARWLVLRFWLRDVRGWAGAMQFGAGHGGIEAILTGLLAALSMISVLALSLTGQAIPEVAGFWQTPWYEFVLAGLERGFAMAAHLAMTLLVMRAVVARRPIFLFGAVAFHCVLNAWAVWGLSEIGIVGVEAGLGVLALGALALIVAWRRADVLGA